MRKQARKRDKKSPVITLLSWLLLIQSWFLLGLAVYHFDLNQGLSLLRQWLFGRNTPDIDTLSAGEFFSRLYENAVNLNLIPALVESLALFFLTILIFIAAIGFFRLWRFAWDMAVFVQGASLLIGIILYFTDKPKHIYLLMAASLFMVIYLSYANVRVLFLPEDRRYIKEEEAR